ncbi:MAG: nucleotidyltransferase family protein [Elusimicrobiota bacterium]
MKKFHAMVVAGGRGKRMGASVNGPPKPMLPFLGRPLIEHLLLWLGESGFEEIHLCLGYKSRDFFDRLRDGKELGLKLRYHIEREPRGTAGAVKDAAAERGGDKDFLVVYGDLFVEMNCSRFLDFHAAGDGLATLAVMATDHPLDSDLVRLDGDTITGFYRAKPGEPFENWAAAAMWVLRRGILDLIPGRGLVDFGRDIFPQAVAGGKKLRAYRTDETLADLGTPERWSAFEKNRKNFRTAKA